MNDTERARAGDAATEIASALGLAVAGAKILHDSNKLTLRLLPCDVVARIASAGRAALEAELDIGRRLTATGSPVARPDPRVEPRVYERDGFALTLWTHYDQSGQKVSSDAYADALERLHTGMARVDVATPHFTDRVEEARRLVAEPSRTPALEAADRELVSHTLRDATRAIRERSVREQLLHGEPHPGNLLDTERGPLFVDFETCCRGPVEFDLAHVPEAVGDRYPDVDRGLLAECRLLALAMVAAWRWDEDDQLPGGRRAGRALLGALRAGPPWPTLDVVMGPSAGRIS